MGLRPSAREARAWSSAIKCLSQVIKFDSVFAGSSPNENGNAHSPNVPMFSFKSEVIYEKSSSENLSREVSIKEIEKEEQLASESKSEENLEVNIVGAIIMFVVSVVAYLSQVAQRQERM